MLKRVVKLTTANGSPIFVDPDRIAVAEPLRGEGETGTLVRVDCGSLVDLEVLESIERVVAGWQNSR